MAMANLDRIDKPAYAAPSIESRRETELLEEVGPAQAYTGAFPFGF